MVLRIADLPSTKASLVRGLLKEKKTRDAEQAFVIEGAKPIDDVVTRGTAALLALVVTPRWLEQGVNDLQRWSDQQQMPVYRCREQIFDRLSDVQTAQGILAIVKKPQWDPAAVFARKRLFGLFGEGLQDPANVGAIVRTAAALGLDAVWLSSDSADVYNSKVVRASAGALLALPIFTLHEGPALFVERRCELLAAETPSSTTVPIDQLTALPARAILALGNESRGLSATTRRLATIRFHIPVSPLVESLNVAASAAIAAFYLARLPRKTG